MSFSVAARRIFPEELMPPAIAEKAPGGSRVV